MNMNNNKLKENIINQINKNNSLLPFLFISKNTEILNSSIFELGVSLLKDFDIPKHYIYHLPDNWENIKINEIKEFVLNSNSKPPFKFQIFFIENVSRLTLKASNSLLKFFEEPSSINIIFLTNNWENWVLDTILSRVQVIDLWSASSISKNEFVFSLLNNYIKNKDPEILSYYFRNKLEKHESIVFLEQLILYIKNTLIFTEYLDEINEDINVIKKNNVNWKGIVDKWLLKT